MLHPQKKVRPPGRRSNRRRRFVLNSNIVDDIHVHADSSTGNSDFFDNKNDVDDIDDYDDDLIDECMSSLSSMKGTDDEQKILDQDLNTGNLNIPADVTVITQNELNCKSICVNEANTVVSFTNDLKIESSTAALDDFNVLNTERQRRAAFLLSVSSLTDAAELMLKEDNSRAILKSPHVMIQPVYESISNLSSNSHYSPNESADLKARENIDIDCGIGNDINSCIVSSNGIINRSLFMNEGDYGEKNTSYISQHAITDNEYKVHEDHYNPLSESNDFNMYDNQPLYECTIESSESCHMNTTTDIPNDLNNCPTNLNSSNSALKSLTKIPAFLMNKKTKKVLTESAIVGKTGKSLTEEMAKLAGRDAVWMARQADLNRQRKDLHGAVTYEFGGIFAWQMYGTADAVDLAGPYTEYVMRCQWGLRWDALYPWMVTRRFREFDNLDQQMRIYFPQLRDVLPTLPAKNSLSLMSISASLGLGLDPDPKVVRIRREGLENYLTVIVSEFPQILRSALIRNFLNIEERIKIIKKIIKTGDSGGGSGTSSSTQINTTSVASQPLQDSGVTSSSSGSSCNNTQTPSLHLAELLTANDAEKIRRTSGTRALSVDELGALEESLKVISQLLRSLPGNDSVAHPLLRQCLRLCLHQWPALRASAQLLNNQTADDRNTTKAVRMLIVRARQAEEDLERIVAEVRSLLVVTNGSLPKDIHHF